MRVSALICETVFLIASCWKGATFSVRCLRLYTLGNQVLCGIPLMSFLVIFI